MTDDRIRRSVNFGFALKAAQEDYRQADALMRATGSREVTHTTQHADGTTTEATASRKTVAELHDREG